MTAIFKKNCVVLTQETLKFNVIIDAPRYTHQKPIHSKPPYVPINKLVHLYSVF